MPARRTPPAARPMRADARRSRERILAAAVSAVAAQGAGASLEEIARRAGVGSATLHRHFPTRQALLEELFRDKVAALCARARELGDGREPGPALAAWLGAVAEHATTDRGLAAALIGGSAGGAPALGLTCHAMISEAGEALMARARQTGAVRPEVSLTDLLTLVTAICLVAEGHPSGAEQAGRLLALALNGVHPPRGPAAAP
ncbi:TetR/AcrR family transcriptional regulator [Sphaerisporangium dianthi]|uniref:TetR/AcrR family transcriptional regulator n=1 Tax=Sphaerisporangium dianthi TaxID=1436120 RepID=A0ABV9CQW5_9ACTN